MATPVPGGVNLNDSVQRRAVERGYLNWFWAQHASELTRQVLLETGAEKEQDRYYAIERVLDLLCEEYRSQKKKHSVASTGFRVVRSKRPRFVACPNGAVQVRTTF